MEKTHLRAISTTFMLLAALRSWIIARASSKYGDAIAAPAHPHPPPLLPLLPPLRAPPHPVRTKTELREVCRRLLVFDSGGEALSGGVLLQ